ncbi:MAG: SUMF1/EgtB/PvdO family nonheme iron enzyme [Anaerolineales bacterium]|nr:SUMF1/EgtB/PvdO family nonheme iron enzyme [Anaerolineales bacterium]
MKPFRNKIAFMGGLLALILAACSPQAVPTPIVIVVTSTPETAAPPPVEVLTEAPTEIVPIIPLTGPVMERGSTIPYVDGSLLVAVPGGEFIMGHGGSDNPEHVVTLGDFWIYRTEVTNQQYALCVSQGGCQLPDLIDNLGYADYQRANDPVAGVTWDQAADYCEFVHGRLPTEAEWEKTARGPDGNLYPWGEAAPECSLLNFDTCTGKTTNVLDYPQGKSYYDALDMAGNTFEWVADWYDPLYYRESPGEDPLGPESGNRRSIRSSAYNSAEVEVPVAKRYYAEPSDHRRDLGFRCVVEDPQYFAPYCEEVAVYGPGVLIPWGSGPDTFDIPVEVCPGLSITQGENCGDGYLPYTVVTFNGPAGASISAPGCVGGPTVFTCSSVVDVEICADCQAPPPPGEPGCKPGFTYDPGTHTCVITVGRPGECLPGMNYDPELECCTAGATLSGGVYSLCPAGTFLDTASNACVPWPVAGTVCENQTVHLMTCQGPGDDDGPCDPPANGCPQGSNWDPNACCCSRNGVCL